VAVRQNHGTRLHVGDRHLIIVSPDDGASNCVMGQTVTAFV
jgi:hypothetical protein